MSTKWQIPADAVRAINQLSSRMELPDGVASHNAVESRAREDETGHYYVIVGTI